MVLVGDDPASQVYVRNKVKACRDAGLHSVLETIRADLPKPSCSRASTRSTRDPTIHGILVQLPLPKHIDPHKVIEAIAPAKDVDGFHVANAGALMTGLPRLPPVHAVRLHEADREHRRSTLRGKHAVVIGRSNIVGKPMALLLLASRSRPSPSATARRADLAAHTRQADVVVAAVGRRNMLTADMVKPGAVVIDVGMNRDDDGKLCGDVDFAGVREVAGASRRCRAASAR